MTVVKMYQLKISWYNILDNKSLNFEFWSDYVFRHKKTSET